MNTSSADTETVSSQYNHDHHVQQLHKRRKISKTILSNSNAQASTHTDLQRSHLQAPIFNIHIHVPPFEGNDLKMNLPKIQPIVHLHFDELARKLELNSQQYFRVLDNLLQTSPKFGDIKFHRANKSKENEVTESEVDGAVDCPSTNCCDTDSETEPHSVTENDEKNIPESKEVVDSSERSNSGTNFGMNLESSSKLENPLMSELKKNFKLKEAVVMLTDVCKTKYYKNMVAANNSETCQNNKNNDEEKSWDIAHESDNNSKEGNKAVEKEPVQLEKESSGSESVTPDYMRRVSDNIDLINNDISSVKAKKMVSSVTNPQETLTALADGCSFSEILSWFRFPKTGFLKSPNKDFYNSSTSQAFNKNEEWNNDFNDQIQEKQITTHLNLDEENSREGTSADIQGQLDIDLENDVKICATNSVRIPMQNELFEDTAFGPIPNKSEMNSDPDYLCIASQKDPSSQNGLKTELNESSCFPSYNNEMKRKALKKTDRVRKLKKKKYEAASTSSPPKKKRSNGQPEKKPHRESRNSPGVEDYIPLQVSGPTKFAVAPLNKIGAYKAHDARNFKREMLFGNRVQRFSSSKDFRTYQLKKRASKNYSK